MGGGLFHKVKCNRCTYYFMLHLIFHSTADGDEKEQVAFNV